MWVLNSDADGRLSLRWVADVIEDAHIVAPAQLPLAIWRKPSTSWWRRAWRWLWGN